MNDIEKLKNYYNEFIERNNNAEKFLNSEKFFEGTEEQQEFWIRAFQEITYELSRLRWEIEAATKKQMSKKEILEGFKKI